MPEFPGGTKALMEYLARNIKYEGPIAQGEIGISGRVIIQIIIDKEMCIRDRCTCKTKQDTEKKNVPFRKRQSTTPGKDNNTV